MEELNGRVEQDDASRHGAKRVCRRDLFLGGGARPTTAVMFLGTWPSVGYTGATASSSEAVVATTPTPSPPAGSRTSPMSWIRTVARATAGPVPSAVTQRDRAPRRW